MKQGKEKGLLYTLRSNIMSLFSSSHKDIADALISEMTYDELVKAYLSKGLDQTIAESFAKRDVLKQELQSKKGKEEAIALKLKEERKKQQEEATKKENLERYNTHVLSQEKADEYMNQFLQVHELLQSAYLIDNRVGKEKRGATYDRIVFHVMIQKMDCQINIRFAPDFDTEKGRQVHNRRKGINYGIDAEKYDSTDWVDIERGFMSNVYEKTGLFAKDSLPSSGPIILDRLCLREDGRGEVYGGSHERKYIKKSDNNWEKDKECEYNGLYPEEIIMLLIMDGILTPENVKKELDQLMQKQLDDLEKSLKESDEKIISLSKNG